MLSITSKRSFVIVVPTRQDDIAKLQGHSHSLLAETVSYELQGILKSTEVCANIVIYLPQILYFVFLIAIVSFLKMVLVDHFLVYLFQLYILYFVFVDDVSGFGPEVGQTASQRRHPVGDSRSRFESLQQTIARGC